MVIFYHPSASARQNSFVTYIFRNEDEMNNTLKKSIKDVFNIDFDEIKIGNHGDIYINYNKPYKDWRGRDRFESTEFFIPITFSNYYNSTILTIQISSAYGEPNHVGLILAKWFSDNIK